MSLRIQSIRIQNFRSVGEILLSPGDLAIFVGRNDSGKSNILRALNLFFNGETMPGKRFDFDTDYNVFSTPGEKKAKEISITLGVALPESYRNANGDYLVWKRRWRQEGLHGTLNDYYGREYINKSRTRTRRVPIPGRSNVHALLKNIKYEYVPAVKDPEYFSQLNSRIYNAIAEGVDNKFNVSREGFEQSISSRVDDLTSQIATSLGFESRLALPKDLSHIFASLDFLSEEKNISLNSRGDGIKARHIPLILKFIGDQKRKHTPQVQGTPPHTFIWGYEEPENNLEFFGCLELADQFWDFVRSDKGISQIFLTTHSPVFYNLPDKQDQDQRRITLHNVIRETDLSRTRLATDQDRGGEIDEQMGTTALFAPKAKELEVRLKHQHDAEEKAKRLAKKTSDDCLLKE